MPHWFIVLVTGLFLSVPVAILLALAWPIYMHRPDLALHEVEMIGLAVSAAVTGTGLAAFAHRKRRRWG